VEPFASSASVYTYNFNPDGDGVYFFRKSCFENQASTSLQFLIDKCKENRGGWYKVENSEIKGIYIKKLEDLIFNNVPEEEQVCTKYDKNETCVEKTPQSLGGENISSMIIKGDYLVLLVYFDSQDKPLGPWTSCQEFPTPENTNKVGPQQIKWENIRNKKGVIPNYLMIIPTKGR
jgi:hypothetical protein